jgi:hypothetical protein
MPKFMAPPGQRAVFLSNSTHLAGIRKVLAGAPMPAPKIAQGEFALNLHLIVMT